MQSSGFDAQCHSNWAWMWACACNASTCEVKAGGSEKVQDHPQEPEASLVYIRSSLTNKQQHNAPLFIDYSLHAEL